jgi:FKBP-type peptidyl-prolyl cis-trans isomerase (trigger factor)
LDVFPEVETINEDWKKHTMKKIVPTVNQEEIDQAVLHLKKNYADYKDAEVIALDTVSKIALAYFDKDGTELDKGHTYVGEPEFAEFPFFKEHFVGKKKGELVELKYDEKKLPTVLLDKKSDLKDKIVKLQCEVKDVKQIVLPEITTEMLEKLFGKDAEVKTEKQLLDFIEKSLKDQKFEQGLMTQIEDILNATRGKNLKVIIPYTLIEEEFKSRVANLEKKFGTKERVEQYFTQMGEEKTKLFLDDIKKAARESLEKFFILQKLVQLLNLEINREKPAHLEIERKIYEKLATS